MSKQQKRNPLYFNPLLRKGGPHIKRGGARRRALKQEMRRQVAEALRPSPADAS